MRALTVIHIAFFLPVSSVAVAQSRLTPPGVVQTPTENHLTPFIPAPVAPHVDYAGAVWIPAAEGNYQAANRPTDQPIDMVVVHDIEGPDAAALSIFQRIGAKVSSHYVVGADGTVYQMVREQDVAWHAGNGDINRRAIGIETHGYAYRPGFFSSTIYEAEAKLVRDITRRYNIPRDRAHIIGHAEVPNPRDPARFGGASGHTDPGPYWDWNTFMALVRNDARVENAQIPTVIRPGEKLPVVVTLQNTGDDVWSANKAPNPRLGLQADAPVVFLGTSQGAPSAFSNLNSWMSPQYADGLKTTDVTPGALARFEFILQGPRNLGETNETLRATRVPTAAQGGTPVAFGEPIALKLNVVPWDITIPNPDTPAATVPPVATESGPVARWTAKLPLGGIWAVYVSPSKPAKIRNKDSFSYKVTTTEGAPSLVVDAKKAGRGVIFGGYYRFPEPSSTAPNVTVTLENAPEGVTGANAGAPSICGAFSHSTRENPFYRGSSTVANARYWRAIWAGVLCAKNATRNSWNRKR